MRTSVFFPQADLLVQVLPFVHAERCFALKGGTALNFFVRDFPRLSVDIDLVYLPVEDRATSLRGIDAALRRIAAAIKRALPGLKVRAQQPAGQDHVVKLGVRAPGGAEVIIEPSTVLRGALHPTSDMTLAPKAAELFGRSATMRVVSLPDLYGGKICAALDRQHPRDLFDVHLLLKNEGLTTEIRQAFVVFLASHDRPMNELLTPNRKDLKQVYEDQFNGMTMEPVALTVLEAAREELVTRINAELTREEREFLLSLKRLEPQWELLGLPGVELLPGPQWKLYNLRKMDAVKRQAAETQLRNKLGL
ncbi:MAG: nucleotidyl transferase AbiEii/AbiGii toxin family protein [Lacunisphaera sp.]|nr:nucleotidyl transferase AbiEii/AbiGii toxin family protein [Lacunisphaera sp.]